MGGKFRPFTAADLHDKIENHRTLIDSAKNQIHRSKQLCEDARTRKNTSRALLD
ncbi:MAG TPA: hypothetical protein VJ761_11230 [Ktedonobacteraceae bacterium]|nr:hypothetical protein [Ktedonobacteraceae bacterium]